MPLPSGYRRRTTTALAVVEGRAKPPRGALSFSFLDDGTIKLALFDGTQDHYLDVPPDAIALSNERVKNFKRERHDR